MVTSLGRAELGDEGRGEADRLLRVIGSRRPLAYCGHREVAATSGLRRSRGKGLTGCTSPPWRWTC